VGAATLILLNLLKGIGIDVPARFAELKARIEQRVEHAADQAKHVVRDAVVTVALAAGAAVTAVAAIAVGLVALARWVADYYGPFTALGLVGGILLLATVTLAAVAVGRQRLSRRTRGAFARPEVGSVAGSEAARWHAQSGSDAANSGINVAVAATEAKSFASELESMARRNPMAVIAGAIVIGVMIGLFSRRS
jgi:hypothetical protein